MRSAENEQHVRQALLWAEVARRTLRPTDALPAGNVNEVILTLWRRATGSALRACCPEADGTGDLEMIWERVDPAVLARAAGGVEFVPPLRALVLGGPSAGAVAETDDFVVGRRIEEFYVRLEDEIRRPERERARRRLRSVVRTAAALVALAVVAGAATTLTRRRPNLVAGRPFATSSSIGSCDELVRCGNAFFHTREEASPWVEYDLDHVVALHEIEITNRTDCCPSRATPLVVEISDDRVTWREAARRDEPFGVWSASLVGQASRYVRIRALKTTILHLRAVEVR